MKKLQILALIVWIIVGIEIIHYMETGNSAFDSVIVVGGDDYEYEEENDNGSEAEDYTIYL